MHKVNCWEFKRCGRETGGPRAKEFGVCPANIESKVDGVNEGLNGGRACWAIAGTLCGGRVQGEFAQKISDCFDCEFYQYVNQEQGETMKSCAEIIFY